MPRSGRAASTTRSATRGRSRAGWPGRLVGAIGAGTGYFAVRFAHRLPRAKIYATDIEPEMVQYLVMRAKREGLPNLVSVQGKPDDAALPEAGGLGLLVG